MNKKIITHGIIITAIIAAVFVAAALTPTVKEAKAAEPSVIKNLAKVDFENKIPVSGTIMIADNDIPLAATPFESSSINPFELVFVLVSVLLIGILGFEVYRDRMTRRIS